MFYYCSFKVKETNEINIQSNLQSLVSLSLSLSLSSCHLDKEINSVATLLVMTAGAANHSCRELTVPLHLHQKVASLSLLLELPDQQDFPLLTDSTPQVLWSALNRAYSCARLHFPCPTLRTDPAAFVALFSSLLVFWNKG